MTDPVPQVPPVCWCDLEITWQPLDGLPSPPPAYEQLLQGSMVYRQNGLWTLHPTDPPGEITHTMDTDTPKLTTTVELSAPSADYQPFPLSSLEIDQPARWKPYRTPVMTIPPDPENPTDTTVKAVFQLLAPSKRLPAGITSTIKPTGPHAGGVIERRPFGPRQRTAALTKSRPTPRQQQLNTDFKGAATFWNAMSGPNKSAWTTAAAVHTRIIGHYALYQQIVMKSDTDLKASLEAKIGEHLSTPSDP